MEPDQLKPVLLLALQFKLGQLMVQLLFFTVVFTSGSAGAFTPSLPYGYAYETTTGPTETGTFIYWVTKVNNRICCFIYDLCLRSNVLWYQ